MRERERERVFCKDNLSLIVVRWSGLHSIERHRMRTLKVIA